jgi:cytochrome b561
VRLRNGERGYGLVTKVLHWLTVLALVGQLFLGYAMDDLSEWYAGERDAEDALVFLHAWWGVGIIVLVTVRLLWRRLTPLPPWSDRLSPQDRVWQHRLEMNLYALLYVVPGTGLALLLLTGEERETLADPEWTPPFDLVDEDVLVALHVASHVALYLVVAAHVALATRRRTVGRML